MSERTVHRWMDAEARCRSLFEAHVTAVRRYAHHRSIVGVDADDLVSETFLVAWRRLDAVPEDDPLPWLLAVAANVRRNHLRARYRYDAAIRRLPPSEVEYAADEPEDLDERIRAVRRALAMLNGDDREILRLVTWDELTPQQAAVVLGCRAGTARARLHRARRRLAALLDAEPDQQHTPRRQRQSAAGQFSVENSWEGRRS